MNILEKTKSELESYSRKLGASLFGIADISAIREEFRLSEKLKKRFDRALSLGVRLIDSVLDDIEDAPTPLYYHHYRQLNYFLDRTAFKVSSYIQGAGYEALPIPASQVIDWKDQQAHVPHKKVGVLAGLGWIGRNNLLVNPEFGARFRLVTILTDVPLDPDNPVPFGCGSCRSCLAACPADAIHENSRDFDHFGCYEKLKEFRNRGLVGQFICGVCVKACRGNAKHPSPS